MTHLQIPLAAQRSNIVQVSVCSESNSQQAASRRSTPSRPPIVIMLSQAGGSINDGMVTSYAEGYATGPIETTSSMNPGSYWVHTTIPQKTLCEASFTAGGASLAREPLVLRSPAHRPRSRSPCATIAPSLKISLPPEADVANAGDEPYYTVYVIPDFDSTTDITPVVLRPSSGGTHDLDGLTPGSYHVYTFASQSSSSTAILKPWPRYPIPARPSPSLPGAPSTWWWRCRSIDASRMHQSSAPPAAPDAACLSSRHSSPLPPPHRTHLPQPAAASTGPYRIAGRVINASTGEPVRRATVSVLGEEDGNLVQSVQSDNEGRFSLEHLPAGKYPAHRIAARLSHPLSMTSTMNTTRPSSPVPTRTRPISSSA